MNHSPHTHPHRCPHPRADPRHSSPPRPPNVEYGGTTATIPASQPPTSYDNKNPNLTDGQNRQKKRKSDGEM
ncbi:hypothetical protein JTE90_005980 [Oedothorax gibbosus]|uniref:Uncharacterized protein n=1 Tax=Oedothorax gibbosus TaxID=931172 RepID=A0AAV6UXR7_9ARAC|nr:hypothetical protein JTE90_005980 [Oedothorax gibbosus]